MDIPRVESSSSSTSCSCSISKVMEGKSTCDQNTMNCISTCQEKSSIKRPSLTFEWPITTRILSQQALQRSQLRMPMHLQVYDLAYFSSSRMRHNMERKYSQDISLIDYLAITSFCKRNIQLTVLFNVCAKIIGKHVMEMFLAICFQDIKVIFLVRLVYCF